jgi:hypothetical protein
MRKASEAAKEKLAETTVESFRESIDRTRAALAGLTATTPASEDAKARLSILRYLDVQLERAAVWADGPVDLLALVLRNLMELRSWASDINRGAEEAARAANRC